MASAIAADRAINRYGRDAVHLWFANTSWEDQDLHRFLADCLARWGGEIEEYRDGRTPLEVAEDEHIIPNQKLAPCTHRLKIEPFAKFIERHPKPVTVLIGMKWTEGHRMKTPKDRYEAIPGVYVDFPLLWEPVFSEPEMDVVRSWGIEPPRLYKLGFSHNNCGGRCVKQGQAEWQRLRLTFPERFAEVRDWEQEQIAAGGAKAQYALLRDRKGGTLKPLTLKALEERTKGVAHVPPAPPEDRFDCFCSAA
jgi:3'-phosphoadenosine 5'-phosphosulfate sulfotransferase (PAPS reductase)/FAD synthetase